MECFRKQILFSIFLILLAQTLHGSSLTISCHPSLVSDANGRIMAVWLVTEGDQTFLKSSVYFPGFGWSTSSIFSTKGNNITSPPQMAINSFGEIVIAWVSYCPYLEKHIIEAAFSTSQDERWTTPMTVSDLDENLSQGIQVSIDDNGHATAIWCSRLEGNPDDVHVRISVAQHKSLWSAPLTLSEM